MPNPLRIGFRNIFLTYAQSNFDNGELLNFLKSKVEAYDCFYVVVSKELHEDGNPHHHALIQLGKKPSIRNTRFFDFHGRHPSIEKAPKEINGNPVCTLEESRNYVIKDGNFSEDGTFNPDNAQRGKKRKADEVYAEALSKYEEGATREEVEEVIKTGAPRDYFTSSSQIDSRLNQLFSHNGPTYDESDFSVLQFQEVPDAVWEWYSKHQLVSSTLHLFHHPVLNSPL